MPSIRCTDWPMELAMFEINPASSQVVFDGDQFSISCRFQSLDNDESDDTSSSTIPFHSTSSQFPSITWYVNGVALRDTESARRQVSVSMTSSSSPSSSTSAIVDVDGSSFPRHSHGGVQPLVTSTVVVRSLITEDAGTWTCLVETPLGRVSKSVSLSVISRLSPVDISASGHVVLRCLPTVVDTDRGTYAWPRTVVGVVRRLPCVVAGRPSIGADLHDPTGSPSTGSPSMASYRCVSPGRWVDLDVGRCQFSAEYTRLLDGIVSAIIHNSSSIITQSIQFKAIVGSGRQVSLAVEIVIVATAVEYLSGITKDFAQLTDVILSVSSAMMNVDETLLRSAELTNTACTRIVSALEVLSKQLVDESSEAVVLKSTENLAVYSQRLNVKRFNGITCLSGQHLVKDDNTPGEMIQYRSISCIGVPDLCQHQYQQPTQIIDASIAIPATFLRGSRCSTPGCTHVTLTVLSYRNARLFPVNDDVGSHVTTSVISTSIGGVGPERNATEIIVKIKQLRSSNEQNGFVNKPVYWDSPALSGRRQGNWLSDGCSIRNVDETFVTFTCSHLAPVTTLQTSTSQSSAFNHWVRGMSARSPIIYTGSTVLAGCLVISISIFIFSDWNRSEQHRRHLLCNVNCAVLALCFLYSFGTHTVAPLVATWVVGCGAQFFSLSSVLWFAMIVRHERRRLTSYLSSSRDSSAHALAMGDHLHHKKSWIVCRYLIGWILPLSVSGIGGIIQWNMTSSRPLWFSNVYPTSLVIYSAAGLLVLFDAIICVQLGCFLYTISIIHRGNISPLSTDDLQLSTGSQLLISSPPHQQQSADLEKFCLNCRLPVVVTISSAFVLGLTTWASGIAASTAIAAAADDPREFSYRNFFTVLYAISSSVLGLLSLVVTLVLRSIKIRRRLSNWFHRSTPCIDQKTTAATEFGADQCEHISDTAGDQSDGRRRSGPSGCVRLSNGQRMATVEESTSRHIDVSKTHRPSTIFTCQRCTGEVEYSTSEYGLAKTHYRRDDDVIDMVDENEASSSHRVGSACNLCKRSLCQPPASRTSYLSSVGTSRYGNTEGMRSSFPLLDLRPTMTSLSPASRATRWRELTDTCVSLGGGDFGISSSLSAFLSRDLSTGRTFSRHSNRLLDFDDDETTFSVDDSDGNEHRDVFDLFEDDTKLVTKATTCSRRVNNCSLYDDDDLVSSTSGRNMSTNVPPPPSPCTNDSVNASESSSSETYPPSITRRCSSKKTSSSRSKVRGAISGHSRPRLRYCREVPWSPRSHSEDRSDDDTRRNAVVDSSSSGLGLGIHTDNERDSRQHHHHHRHHTHNHRSRFRRPNSRSKDLPRDQPDSPSRLVYSDEVCLPRASHASITDCPPPSPSSDYFRLNLWAGEPPDGADCDDEADSVEKKKQSLFDLDLADSGDDRRSPFSFHSRSSNIWHTQLNEMSDDTNKLDILNVVS